MKKLKLALIFVLVVLVILLGVAASYYKKPKSTSNETQQGEELSTKERTPLDILEFSIGDRLGTVTKQKAGKDTQYVICITLPIDTDFKNCIANITLPNGTQISEESPCYRTDLGGRPVLDLTLDERTLIVTNGSESRSYEFEISLDD